MRRLRLLPLTLLVLALMPAAAHAKIGIGIADNKSDMFTDPRFTALKVKYVRVMVPYDAMHDYALRTWLDGWMAGAKAGYGTRAATGVVPSRGWLML